MSYILRVTLLVKDYDEAIAFYAGKLGFTVTGDTAFPEENKRWVTISPPGAPSNTTTIVLAKASTPEQEAAVGNQAGGRVFLFLSTDNFTKEHTRLAEAGVEWVRPVKQQPYGKVAVFRDLYGNLWDFIGEDKTVSE